MSMKTLFSGTLVVALLTTLAPGCDDDTRPPAFTELGGTAGGTLGSVDGGASNGDAMGASDGSPFDTATADAMNLDASDGDVQADRDVVSGMDLGGPAITDNGFFPTEDRRDAFNDAGFGPVDIGGAVVTTDRGGPMGPMDNGGVLGPADLGPNGPVDLGPNGPADLGPTGPVDLGP